MDIPSPLLDRMRELKDLSGVIGLATWDQETYLPLKAARARAEQLGTLQAVHHQRLTDGALGEWLAKAQASPLSEDARAAVRVLTWERDRAVKVPERLVRALAEAQSEGVGAWRAAREENRFARFAPALGRLLTLRREQADALGHGGERYDALLENFEPGMRVARLTPVLAALRERLTPLVRSCAAAEAARAPDPFAGKRFPADAQWTFSLRLLADMGFDLEAGRQDRSIHPFTGGTHPTDVRLTTRVDEADPFSTWSSTVHEGGHGLYEQGFAEADHRTPLAAAPSMGLHESQSRLWENCVGRGRAFWAHYAPALRELFPDALGGVDAEALYRAVNRVRPSLIRVEADEVTYNLHIVLRYELELALLSGDLPLAELPGAWNGKMKALLGIEPPDDTRGVLQDIHWAWGELGYFPTYALGNLYAATLYRAAREAVPGLEEGFRRGEFRPLTRWLRENIHRPGFRTYAEDRVRSATGRGLNDEDFLSYLRGKYADLYRVSLN
ncbi:MAG TPA: carboxypeptidase M32 [Myxococcaceae bacterium]|nr:carboxypeptidase M32 [Myxococcaceae bacterium]